MYSARLRLKTLELNFLEVNTTLKLLNHGPEDAIFLLQLSDAKNILLFAATTFVSGFLSRLVVLLAPFIIGLVGK